jgi:hypothetical protein
MAEKISFTLAGHHRVIDAPNKCPICHHIVIIKESISIFAHQHEVQLVFRCPNNDCESFFIAYYEVSPNGEVSFKCYKPLAVSFTKFPQLITSISPSFIDIYKEAEEARQIGLSQISGPGYRKAFEFLVKDYAKSLVSSEKHPEIEKSFAGNVVNNYIQDKRIQAVSKRALWLGNDETHYLRKWGEKDVTDLITLIDLTIRWIEIEKISSDYISEMPE